MTLGKTKWKEIAATKDGEVWVACKPVSAVEFRWYRGERLLGIGIAKDEAEAQEKADNLVSRFNDPKSFQ